MFFNGKDRGEWSFEWVLDNFGVSLPEDDNFSLAGEEAWGFLVDKDFGFSVD